MPKEPALALEQLPDGVYLDLPEDIYFGQDRLGSSDLMKLYRFKEGWWWQSRHNPDRAESTDAQNYGSALHAIMLEGTAAYETRFRVQPDPKDYDNLLTTIPQIKEALGEEGVDLRGTSSFKLPDWLDAAAVHLPEHTCWEAVKRDFEASITDKITGKPKYRTVTAVEDRMLRLMREVAMDDTDVRAILGFDQDVPVLAEVSVLWTDRFGRRRRGRWDKPCPQFNADLKSIGNWQGRDLKHALGDRVLFEAYDLQCADTHVSRQIVNEWLAGSDRMLSGGTLEERSWLQAMAQRAKRWAWWWLFYQKPEPTGRAPILFPLYAAWGGRFHRSGFRKIAKALEVYDRGVERFGLGEIPNALGGPAKPWTRVEAKHYEPDTPGLPEGAPTVSLPMFGWEDEAVEDEERHFQG